MNSLCLRHKFGFGFLVAFLLASPGSRAQTTPNGQTYVLAAPGDPTPNGLDTYDFPGNFVLSNTGSLFTSHLKKADLQGLFSTTLAGKREVLRVGDVVPGMGRITGVVGNLSTNDQTTPVIYVGAQDTGNVTREGLLVGTVASDMRVVVASDQTVPDGNGQYNSFGLASINHSGAVGFWGSIKNGGGPLNTTNGVYIGQTNGTITQLMRSGQTAPGESYAILGVGGEPLIKDSGQVFFGAGADDPYVSTSNNSRYYRASSPADIVRIAKSYDPLPGTPYLLGSFGQGDMNESGGAVFFTYLIDAQGTFLGRAIVKGNGLTLAPVAYSGQNAPNGLGKYTDFDNSAHINDAGAVAYVGYYKLGSKTNSGLFLGDGVTQRPLILAGQLAPGGAKFSGFFVARANNVGTVLFGAQLNGSSTIKGIFLTDGVDTLKVAQAGDTVNGKAIAQLGIDGKAFNDGRQVAYQAIFTDNSISILLFAPALNWRVNGNGNWEDAVNWTASLVPAVYNDVNIVPPDDARIYGPMADASVRQLRIGATNSGTADLVLRAGTLTASGGVTVAPRGRLSGNGRIVGDVINQATLAPGNSPGAVTVQGNLTQAATGLLDVDVASPIAVSGFDVLTVTGNATLAGTLRVNLLPGAAGKVSGTRILPVLNVAGTLSGAFGNAPNGSRLTTADGLGSFQVNYGAHAVTLSNFVPTDTDGDGLPDQWTQQFFGHPNGQTADRSGAAMDADGDGVNNREEFLAGTDPTSAASVLKPILSRPAGNAATLSLSFPTVSGRTYAVEHRGDLAAGAWDLVQGGIAGDGTTKSVSVPGTATLEAPAGFYRVRVTP